MELTANTPDRRQTPRRRALLAALVQFDAGTKTLSCRVRNLSDAGAKLEISSAAWLPMQFDLDIEHQGRRIPARVKWRSETEAGIAFIQ